MGTRGLTAREESLIADVHSEAELFHDDLQLRYFILGQSGHGTVFGVWKQAQREVETRNATLGRMDRDAACRRAELAYAHTRAQRWAFTAKARCERDKARQEVLHLRESEDTYQRQRAHVVRELKALLDVYASASKELGSVSPERRAELEEDYWTTRLQRQLNLQAISHTTSLDIGLLETLMSLPTACYSKVLSVIDNRDARAFIEKGLGSMRAPEAALHSLVAPTRQKELTECQSSS